MRFCSARKTPPVLEASVDGEKRREHILCSEQICNSKPSGSNVAVAATRLNCALSNVQQSAQSQSTKNHIRFHSEAFHAWTISLPSGVISKSGSSWTAASSSAPTTLMATTCSARIGGSSVPLSFCLCLFGCMCLYSPRVWLSVWMF